MANHKRDNERKITTAFRELPKMLDAAAEMSMKRILAAGMKYALDIHDQNHFVHRTADDSYGWILAKDGRVVECVTNRGNHGVGTAYDQLVAKVREAGVEGWVGIVLASMEVSYQGRRPVFFEVQFEMDVLNETADLTEESFNRFFKSV